MASPEEEACLPESPPILYLKYTATTTVQDHTTLQVAGFAILTIAWILSSTSMGLVEWRVCHMDDPSFFSSVVCVGMWRLCIYSHEGNFSKTKKCYLYRNTFLPPDIRIAQYLLLATSTLGLLGKAFAILGLRKVHVGSPPEDRARTPFITAGLFTMAACVCISVAVFRNFHSIMNEQSMYFPLSFQVPFQPGNQQMGSTMVVATLGALLLLLSGIFFLSYRYPLDIQVHPDT
ncbi:PREDICTED: claudin-34-like [Chinchilla lanigera]|uniref:claudin-34-like n=1 Tax=Chinchilla lanigera TaxID=34839 RepID=UPI000698B494|nr:PREDICTED: claudin-34-like [Chinchilla lanigera]